MNFFYTWFKPTFVGLTEGALTLLSMASMVGGGAEPQAIDAEDRTPLRRAVCD